MINILFLGDIFGRSGRRLVRELLPGLVNRHAIDLVVANGENASGGMGLTIEACEELYRAGIDILTSGNHIFKHREIYGFLDRDRSLLRPANYPAPCPGRGFLTAETAAGVRVGVINVLGRTFMSPVDCPFQVTDAAVESLKKQGVDIVVVDVHAEATSEKKALAWHLAGRVTAVLGTHTHVQTADEQILAGGTAYISDLGMTGPHESVIGMKKETVIERFLTGRPTRFEAANRGLKLEGAVVRVEERGGRAENIERIQCVVE